MVLNRNSFSELCIAEKDFFLFRQLELSEGTSRALRILNKGHEYIMPKPEEDLDSESAEEHNDLPEQSSESSSDLCIAEQDFFFLGNWCSLREHQGR